MASSVSRTEAGSAWVLEPPIVSRCLICGSSNCPAAWAISGTSRRRASVPSTSWCRVSAPIAVQDTGYLRFTIEAEYLMPIHVERLKMDALYVY